MLFPWQAESQCLAAVQRCDLLWGCGSFQEAKIHLEVIIDPLSATLAGIGRRSRLGWRSSGHVGLRKLQRPTAARALPTLGA